MPVYHREFDEMHREMERWIIRRESEGWSSPEEEHAARRLLNALWMFANNRVIHHIMLKMLAEDTDAFSRARGHQ